jgi:type IV pilus assembly protein PilB
MVRRYRENAPYRALMASGHRGWRGTGYSERLPIYEIMLVTPAMAEGIENGLPATKLRQIAVVDGMIELAAAGMEQVLAGRTTLEEVFYKLSG